MNYFYRLIQAGLATYNDIDNWKYSNEQLSEMHEMLDLKERIDTELAEAAKCQK